MTNILTRRWFRGSADWWTSSNRTGMFAALLGAGVLGLAACTSPTPTPTGTPTRTLTPTQSPLAPTPTPTPIQASPIPTAPAATARGLDFSPSEYRQLLPRDAIRPIYTPEFVGAEEATLDDGELVLGVEINGESKAYPVGPLICRAVVIDELGGVPILVTW